MSLEEFLQCAREGELEIERMSDMLLRLDARAKRVTAVYRQSGGTKGDGPEAICMQLAEQRDHLLREDDSLVPVAVVDRCRRRHGSSWGSRGVNEGVKIWARHKRPKGPFACLGYFSV